MQSFKVGKIVKHVKRRATQSLLIAGVLAATSQFAHAGAEFKLGDDASMTFGIGLRTSFTTNENGAPSGTAGSDSFAVENARIYLGGAYGKFLKATMNFNASGGAGTAAAGTDGLRLIDGIARFEFSPELNFWAGRMLPPSDRANLYGPFFTAAWAFPGVAQNYPQATAGRDTGAMVWGDTMGGKLSYSAGVFNGHNRGASNMDNKVLYAGRLEVNFWDPQTGVYRDGTYFGSKNVLALGLAGFSQADGVGTAAARGKLKIWSVDGFYEQKLSGGWVPTLEGIYYSYDTGGVLDCGSIELAGPPTVCGGTDNVGGQVAGNAYIVTGALLLPMKAGIGQFQPFLRYQKYSRDVSNSTSKATEFGLNYIIKGPNAKVSAVYTKFEDDRPTSLASFDQFVLGVQLQY